MSEEARRISVSRLLLATLATALGCTSSPKSFERPGEPDASPAPGFGAVDGGECATGQELGCRKADDRCIAEGRCQSGADCTTIEGRVLDPSGKLPVYNAMVYIPPSGVEPITQGVSCDRCASVALRPLASALTDINGHFVLRNVPTGDKVPLVVQLGKWRRVLEVPNAVEPCKQNVITSERLTRLPRNASEGDMPKILVATGISDRIECLLTKLGISGDEFAPADNANAHVHIAKANGAEIPGAMVMAPDIWRDANKLKQYDVVILGCEGFENHDNKGQAAVDAMAAYTAAGGRVFATHYHRYWFRPPTTGDTHQVPADLHSALVWRNPLGEPIDNPPPVTCSINTSFPKGRALADWLGNQGGTSGPAEVVLREVADDLAGVSENATSWITAQVGGSPKYASFNTPQTAPEAERCGRVVFSDLHVASSASQIVTRFPENCSSGELTPQEKLLAFLLFDLSACVYDDKAEPPPVR